MVYKFMTATLAAFTDKYPEILRDLQTYVINAMTEHGISAEHAKHAGLRVTEEVRKQFGGQMIYIPKGMDYEISTRDQEIWQKFNGKNHAALCHEFDISLQWLYKIIKYMRAEDVKRRQTSLLE